MPQDRATRIAQEGNKPAGATVRRLFPERSEEGCRNVQVDPKRCHIEHLHRNSELIIKASFDVTIRANLLSFCFDFDPDTDPEYCSKLSKILKEV